MIDDIKKGQTDTNNLNQFILPLILSHSGSADADAGLSTTTVAASCSCIPNTICVRTVEVNGKEHHGRRGY